MIKFFPKNLSKRRKPRSYYYGLLFKVHVHLMAEIFLSTLKSRKNCAVKIIISESESELLSRGENEVERNILTKWLIKRVVVVSVSLHTKM